VGEGVEEAVKATLDLLLLVFIFVELLGAVRTTIRERKLVAEPFLIIGIIASIKEIVVVSISAKDNFGTALRAGWRRRSSISRDRAWVGEVAASREMPKARFSGIPSSTTQRGDTRAAGERQRDGTLRLSPVSSLGLMAAGGSLHDGDREALDLVHPTATRPRVRGTRNVPTRQEMVGNAEVRPLHPRQHPAAVEQRGRARVFPAGGAAPSQLLDADRLERCRLPVTVRARSTPPGRHALAQNVGHG